MKTLLINDNWMFYKGVGNIEDAAKSAGEKIKLPHTWNNMDGQDGGSDYFRGACLYVKKLNVEKKADKVYYIEFRAVNSVADVFVNGSKAVHHEGGFSTFRANITDLLVSGENTVAVVADNSPSDRIYPQMADFTFFGGIYRNVYLIETEKSRFDLDYYGGEGVMVTPVLKDDGKAEVTVQAFVTNPEKGQQVAVKVTFDGKDVALGAAPATDGKVVLSIDKPELWDGVKKPSLYKATVILTDGKNLLDEREIEFGVRSFSVDKDGFVLNGRRYPLRGVARHQDRLNMGWAITEKEHEEDMKLISEVGANTIRLAHYQHDSYFYSLADRYGMVIWAEIPYISAHLPAGDENAISQMKELIVQNYNHPSIMFWGLSNEITIGGESEELIALHHKLNDLCHEMDKTRLTTMANVTMLEPTSELTKISDIMSYNHYFGWYVGDVSQNADWLDDFRKEFPDRPIGLSEYGCEAILTWHSSDPKQGDYTEEYQAYYHENMLKIFAERPYLWATHVWNMFDFGVDGRDEGGVKGRNNKGLVTYDRKTKKNSFYLYKAYWSDEPFVHIASKRYVKRPEKVAKIKVYTNQDKVTLFANGKKIAEKSGKYVFEFDVPLHLIGKNKIKAVSGNCVDEAEFVRVLKPEKGYSLKKEETGVVNWFEKDGVRYEFKYPEGMFSIRDKLGVIMANPDGEALIMRLVDRAVAEMKARGEELPFQISKNVFKLASSMTIERIAGMAGGKITPEILFHVNEELNKIPKK